MRRHFFCYSRGLSVKVWSLPGEFTGRRVVSLIAGQSKTSHSGSRSALGLPDQSGDLKATWQW